MVTLEKIKTMQKLKNLYTDLIQNPITNAGVCVGLFDENDIFNWKLTMIGPQDSPYRDGLFYLKIKFPENYPKQAPEVCFISPIYHVNVNPCLPKGKGGDPLGHICISDLNWWKETQDLRQLLVDIFALFYLGNPDSPYGTGRAEELRNNKSLYDKKVAYFTKKYADSNAPEAEEWTTDWDFTYTG